MRRTQRGLRWVALLAAIEGCGASTGLEVALCNALELGPPARRETMLARYPILAPTSWVGGALADGTYRLVAAVAVLPDGGIASEETMTLEVRGERWSFAWAQPGAPAQAANARAAVGPGSVTLSELCGSGLPTRITYLVDSTTLYLVASGPTFDAFWRFERQ